MQEVRLLLESVIQENLVKQLKRQIYDTIKDTISKEIKERVQREVLLQKYPFRMSPSQPYHPF
jgi:hypothetical protein